MVSIYALVDPRTDEIRYVGKSVDPERRCLAHLREAKKSTRSRKQAWIRSLLNVGLYYQVKILEDELPDGLCEAREQFWIKELAALGHRLTNETSGGEHTVMSQQTCNKLRSALLRNWNDPAYRARMLNTHNNNGARKRQSVLSKKLWKDPEYRKKTSDATRRSRTPEVRKAIADKARTRWADPAYKARVIKKVKQSCSTSEFRIKMSKVSTIREAKLRLARSSK